MNKNTFEMLSRLQNLGIKSQDALALRRIAMTFSRWDELCCGNSNDFCSYAIERDEETDIPYMVTHPHNGMRSNKRRIPDREKGAEKRLAKIMADYPDLVSYHQGDPRGASLYILRKSDVSESDIGSIYNRGVAVFA